MLKAIGLDLAKHVFQIHGVDPSGRVALRRRLRRSQITPFFANLPPCLVGVEACASAHFWARTLTTLGHDVKILPTQYVKPYAQGGKNDATDARAICDAVCRPAMPSVPIKTANQQALQALHRLRARLVRDRTAAANQMRSHLAEDGRVCAQGLATLRREVVALLDPDTAAPMSPLLRTVAQLWLEQVEMLDRWLDQVNRQLHAVFTSDETCQRLGAIRGVGPMIATAVVATVGDVRAFRNGRHFAAWVGLTPRQHSSGQRTRLLGITKRGDTYLRTLLVQGARAVLKHVARYQDAQAQWLRQLLQRRHRHVVAIALANKLARVIWVVLAKGAVYQRPAPVAG